VLRQAGAPNDDDDDDGDRSPTQARAVPVLRTRVMLCAFYATRRLHAARFMPRAFHAAQVEKDIGIGLQRRRAFTTSLLQSLFSLLSKSRARHGTLLKRLDSLSAGEAAAALQAELKRVQAVQSVATRSAETVPASLPLSLPPSHKRSRSRARHGVPVAR
jgi:hypothetical protein